MGVVNRSSHRSLSISSRTETPNKRKSLSQIYSFLSGQGRELARGATLFRRLPSSQRRPGPKRRNLIQDLNVSHSAPDTRQLAFPRSGSRAQFGFASPCRTFSGSSRLSKMAFQRTYLPRSQPLQSQLLNPKCTYPKSTESNDQLITHQVAGLVMVPCRSTMRGGSWLWRKCLGRRRFV